MAMLNRELKEQIRERKEISEKNEDIEKVVDMVDLFYANKHLHDKIETHRTDIDGRRKDFQALKGDWNTVGKDIESIIGRG